MGEWLELGNVQTYARGDILQGKVLQVNDNGVLVDIGYKSEAIMKLEEVAPFRQRQLQSGDSLDVLVTYIDEDEGTVYVSEKMAIYEKRIGELEIAFRKNQPVSGVIEGEVKNAGYHVNLMGVRAFLP
ncbi:MAG TPA: S1 RNA-binding domain-containing protein, partial [Candidatus Bipolaricaulota bacterium]